MNNGEAIPSNNSTPAATAHLDPYSSPTNGISNMRGAYGTQYNQYTIPHVALAGGVRTGFKPSPFYDIVESIVGNIVLDVSPSHRKTTNKSLQLTGSQGDRMRADPQLKLMLFSSMDQPGITAYALHDIAFPQQFEVKINGDEVKANWKGLKNKPGSTRPADITDSVRKSPANYRNNMEITYALTTKVGLGGISLSYSISRLV